MLQAALKEKVIGKVEKKKKKKGLHGEFVQQASDVVGEEPWRWLRNVFSNSLILAASSIKQMVRRESTKTVWHIGSATTSWPCGYSGRCAGNTPGSRLY